MFILTPERPTYPADAAAPNEWFRSGKYRRLKNGKEEKRCASCSRYLPATLDHFGRCSTSRDGKHDWCKTCARQYSRARTKDRLTIAAAAALIFAAYLIVHDDPLPALYPLDALVAQVAP